MLCRTLRVLAVLLCIIALVGCEGEKGPTGPAGEDGNANVIIYDYGTRTTTSGDFAYSFEATAGMIDSSLVLAYAKDADTPADLWYPVPGLGPNNWYMIRSFIDQTSSALHSYEVRLRTPDGASAYTSEVTFSRFRIVLAPASEIIPLTAVGTLDVTDYGAVREHFGLAD
jgi:hypothetical protein